MQANQSIYDGRSYISTVLRENIQIEQDWFWSPVFSLVTGFEFTIKRHFLFIVSANYIVSNFGTEDIYGIDSKTDIRSEILPEVIFGWVHQLAGHVGIGLNIFRRKR